MKDVHILISKLCTTKFILCNCLTTKCLDLSDQLSRAMLSNLWRELNDFLSSTSVHGLPYIHRSQSGTTRVIWTVLVAGALITATVLLVQTVGDWDTNYISTTLKTRGIENYPFPAVTFHPGDFPTRKHFLRTLLNHFEMTRYNESSPLYDNSVFMKKFSKFLFASNFLLILYEICKITFCLKFSTGRLKLK